MASERDGNGRPLYNSDVDFTALALKDADFAKLLSANKGKLDFKQPAHVLQLTQSILNIDFELKLDLPTDRLCPPIPVRFNYVRWLQDLIDTTSPSYSDTYDRSRRCTGLDIGVGSSNIYSLLTLSTRTAWRMCGTDIDQTNYTSAAHNTEMNGLSDRVRLLQTTASDPLIPLDELGVSSLDFVMCNPPFFSSVDEMHKSLTGEGKSGPPSATCTGAEVEMVTPGGDFAFVLRIVEESLVLREKVQWYSSMFGKWSSAQKVMDRLRDEGISNYAVCALRAGGKTARWAVAWSFSDLRPSNEVARRDMTVKEVLPFPTERVIDAAGSGSDDAVQKHVVERLNQIMEDLDVRWKWQDALHAGVMLTRGNVWSRAARRQRKRQQTVGTVHTDDTQPEVALAVKITVSGPQVLVRWLRGYDQVLWESFCGMLTRLLRTL